MANKQTERLGATRSAHKYQRSCIRRETAFFFCGVRRTQLIFIYLQSSFCI